MEFLDTVLMENVVKELIIDRALPNMKSNLTIQSASKSGFSRESH